MSYPATTIEAAFRACNPAENLGPDDLRYVDFSAARGEGGTTTSLCRRSIEMSDTPLVQLLAGHRGCGKSTELRQLQQSLVNSGFLVALIDAELDLDLEDTESPDLLLAFIRGLEAALREQDVSLPANDLKSFEDWFTEVTVEKSERTQFDAEVRSEAEMKGGIPFFASLLAKVTGTIKRGTDSKVMYRQKLEPRLTQLVDRGAFLFRKARQAVQATGKKDLVLIVDGLDRIALKDKGHGRSSHEMLFIDHGDLLKGFGCHIVLTVPISLMFSKQAANLLQVFSDRHVLPMIKVADRDGQPWPEGRELLRTAIRTRVDSVSLFEAGVEDRLIEACGGHPRQLMLLLRYALLVVDEAPVTLNAVDRAIHDLRNDYDRSVPSEHWPLLAKVARKHEVQNDADHQLMLYNLSVLEYQNSHRWCDVNPVIRELRQFVEALQQVDQPSL